MKTREGWSPAVSRVREPQTGGSLEVGYPCSVEKLFAQIAAAIFPIRVLVVLVSWLRGMSGGHMLVVLVADGAMLVVSVPCLGATIAECNMFGGGHVGVAGLGWHGWQWLGASWRPCLLKNK